MVKQLESLSERYEVFYARLRLSEDPKAHSYLMRMQAAMLQQDSTWGGFFQTYVDPVWSWK
jgi:hypothetical protein